MHLWIITFFLGISALAFCPELPSLYWLLLLPPISFIWQFIAKRPIWMWATLLRHILIFTIGFSWALIYTHWIMAWSLPAELEGKKILIIGYITSLPITKPHHISFEFKTDTIGECKNLYKTKTQLV